MSQVIVYNDQYFLPRQGSVWVDQTVELHKELEDRRFALTLGKCEETGLGSIAYRP